MNNKTPKPVFYFNCPGETKGYTKLVLRDRHVNKQIKDICQKNFVRIAYNQYRQVFEVGHPKFSNLFATFCLDNS